MTSNAAHPTAFGILSSEPGPGLGVISVEGELDLSSAPRLKWTLIDLLESAHSRLVVDLSLATFLDSTALGVLVGGLNIAEATATSVEAAYRFFDNAAIDPQNLLDSHVDATLTRLAPVPLVLAVQDTTELDWTAHPATTGLGPLGHSAHRGLLVHTTLAFTPERVPLGVLAQQV